MAGRTRLARLGGKEPVQVAAAGLLASVPPALTTLAAALLALALLFGLARAQVPARSAAALGSVCSLLVFTTSGCNCGHSAGTVAPITATHYHGDHLGGTTLLTAQDGSVAAEIAYDPWGAEIVGATEPYAFTGKEYEPDTGLYDFAARVYDPVLARFLSPDPLAVFEPDKALGEYNGWVSDPGTGLNDYGARKAGSDLANPASFNRYSYVLNNPYKYVDPDGCDPVRVSLSDCGDCHNGSPQANFNKALAFQGHELEIVNTLIAVEVVGGLVAIADALLAGDVTAAGALAAGDAATQGGGRGGTQFRGPDTRAKGAPHTRFRSDDRGVTTYETYGDPVPGQGKRVDVVGPPHGDVPTPHTVQTQKHVNPKDPSKSGYTESRPVPSKPDEIPKRQP
jgi:RHS repeat-associated protein